MHRAGIFDFLRGGSWTDRLKGHSALWTAASPKLSEFWMHGAGVFAGARMPVRGLPAIGLLNDEPLWLAVELFQAPGAAEIISPSGMCLFGSG